MSRDTSAPTQTDGSGWSQASRGSEGRLGESPVCVCALAQENNVFIIDEPELSLHVQWQELFVDSIISANPNIQYVLATHSPSIILDRIENCVDLVRRKPKRSKAR